MCVLVGWAAPSLDASMLRLSACRARGHLPACMDRAWGRGRFVPWLMLGWCVGCGQVIARSRQVWSKEADKADLRSRTAFVAGDFFRSGALAAPACPPPGAPGTPGCCSDHVFQTRTMQRHGLSERVRAPWPGTGSR